MVKNIESLFDRMHETIERDCIASCKIKFANSRAAKTNYRIIKELVAIYEPILKDNIILVTISKYNLIDYVDIILHIDSTVTEAEISII